MDSVPILLRTLLSDAGLEPKQVKVLRHTIDRADLFAIWRRDRPQFEAYQAIQKQTSRPHFTRPWWASFVKLRDGRTVFVGLYHAALAGPAPIGFAESLGRQKPNPEVHHLYDTELTDRMSEYVGRLFIGWSGMNWRQNGEGLHEVMELSRKLRDPDFPGLLEFARPLSEIEHLPDAWCSHLRQAKGVYLLTCPRTREQYVGKADGADGFLGRWLSYVATGDGGNVRMKIREPSDYQVCILEAAGTAATPHDILRMEQRWMQKLQTRQMGLN